MNESRVVCVGVCVRLVVSWAHRTDLVAERRWHCLRPRRRMGYMDVILIPRSASGWRRRSTRFRSGQRTQQCGSFVLRPPYNDNSDTTTATTMMMMMGTERSVCALFVAVLEVGWASHTIWVFCFKQSYLYFIYMMEYAPSAIRHTRDRAVVPTQTHTHTHTRQATTASILCGYKKRNICYDLWRWPTRKNATRALSVGRRARVLPHIHTLTSIIIN